MTDANYLLLGPELGEKKEFIKSIKIKLEKKFSSPPRNIHFIHMIPKRVKFFQLYRIFPFFHHQNL